jgi:hypothetical protein
VFKLKLQIAQKACLLFQAQAMGGWFEPSPLLELSELLKAAGLAVETSDFCQRICRF